VPSLLANNSVFRPPWRTEVGNSTRDEQLPLNSTRFTGLHTCCDSWSYCARDVLFLFKRFGSHQGLSSKAPSLVTFIMRVITLSTLVALAFNSFAPSSARLDTCTYPEPCWPSQTEWNLLNVTLRGSLARARPPAYPCHAPNYNEAQCQIVKQNWTRLAICFTLHV
jgi:hypothetical protein